MRGGSCSKTIMLGLSNPASKVAIISRAHWDRGLNEGCGSLQVFFVQPMGFVEGDVNIGDLKQ